jgi:hypothetical protein
VAQLAVTLWWSNRSDCQEAVEWQSSHLLFDGMCEGGLFVEAREPME